MWKAVLVLFMTSNTQPLSTMVGQFPDAFMDKKDCQAFIARTSEDIEGTIAVFTQHAKLDFEVLEHEMHCFEDDSGAPA